jgi:hypothetical protein
MLLFLFQRLSWHRQSVWMTQLSNLRFGILLARNDTTVLPPCITGTIDHKTKSVNLYQ